MRNALESQPKALESGPPAARPPWWKRRPPTGIAGAVFWLALWFGLLWLLRQVPAADNPLLTWMQALVGLALIGLAFPLAWKMIRTHLLWSLRNKLILTYLLIGLAPVVMLLTLAAISAYIAVGQFSIHLADTRMHKELDEMGVQNAARVSGVVRIMRIRAEDAANGARPSRPGPPGSGSPNRFRRQGSPGFRPDAPTPAASAAQQTPLTADELLAQATPTAETLPDTLRARLHPHTSIYVNGASLPSGPGVPGGPGGFGGSPGTQRQPPPTQAQSPLGFAPWAADLQGKEFRGLVLDGENLYLVAIDQRRVEGGPLVSVITSLPVDNALLDVIAEGLGRVHLAGVSIVEPQNASQEPKDTAKRIVAGGVHSNSDVYGGIEPGSIGLADLRVHFTSTLDTIDWDTGEPAKMPALVDVASRPSLLYRQLFGSSLGGFLTSSYRDGVVALCVLFALIEALALWMAFRLSGTITSSVHELYEATQRVDRGDFVPRISASSVNQQDQLGELARSFNLMTGSLARLMVEQKEKERLQSELSIAQEVQANLFPHHARNLPTLELHGICRPARSVSGDYYDFLVFHHKEGDGHQHHDAGDLASNGHAARESGVGIVLGDISGKGISAALLMATLHSAVRAYRFASEDLVYSDSTIAGLLTNREHIGGDAGKLFESPSRILSLLNRHLYRSTQPEKYATLFLAHYDAATAQLTYSNAGHLPPLVLSRDGKIRRLDRGGTVVGLMDGMSYEEGSIQMRSGDILVAYSDGVTEPENDFGDFGEDRLMEVVTRYRDQPLHVISAQVMLALDAWIGAEEQPDDITLVLARQI